ncbi:FAD-dependent oxidoreductase [Pararhodobacter sp. SW119]|uniref:NAD(P)/FAD-dependent oxidoreductase n=1 Tax=Pararhodobacter sp. SW119 TaxID=2780075 RepID=UPI001AE003E2|nr:FAD-dependent oxidoreductase [Pararhodobacter sp. SW119]
MSTTDTLPQDQSADSAGGPAAASGTVAIIGAGIVGVATALWLQRFGRKVILIDRAGPAEGASFGNGGVLAACSVVPVTVPGLLAKAPRMLFDPGQPLFLRWGYLPRLAPWLIRYLRHGNAADVRRIATALHGIIGDSLADHRALAAGTGAERFVVPSDYMFLYRDRAAYDADAFGWEIRRDLGLTYEEMDGEALRAHDPVYGPAVGYAVRVPDHGRISDPGAYVRALADHVVAQGGALRIAEVTDIACSDGRVTGLRLRARDGTAETLECDAAVIATGAWSGALAAKLGLKVPLESERGYHIELWEPSAMPKAPGMIAAGKFVATPMEGRLRLAGVVEFGGLDAPPSRPPVEFLKRQVAAAFPGLTWRKMTEWMGHRPAPTDSIPLIGPVPGVSGAYLAFGHHHVGLTGGPRTGQLLAQLIAGKRPNIDLAPYAPSRFQ